MRHFWTLLCATAVLLSAASAVAAPVVDNDAGEWLDDYVDNLGVDLASMDPATQALNVTFDPFGRLMTMAEPPTDPSAPSQYATTPISPASFDAWGSAYINYSAAAPTDIDLVFVGISGTAYDLGTIGPSDDPSWTGQVSLAAVPVSETQGQLVVTMRATDVGGTLIRPTIQGLRATWSPRSIVRITQEILDPSVCSREEIVYRVRVSVSLVEAKNLVVWAPLGTPSSNPFGQDNTLLFAGAKEGGQFLPATAAPLTLGDSTIPPGSVYWQLGTRPAGNTFIVSYSARSPQGTINSATYTSTAFAQADNADFIETAASTATITSTARPFLRKTTSGTFRLFQRDHALSGSDITYNLSLGNHDFGISTTQCGETYFQAVAVDDVSGYFVGADMLFVDPPAIHTISHGGQFHAGPNDLCVGGTGAACDGGRLVAPMSVFWELGDIRVGQRQTLSYKLTLENDTADTPPGPLVDGQEISGTASFESLFEGNARSSASVVVIGIDNSPSGSYGTGDSIRGSSGITAGANNNRFLSVNYGEPVTFLYAIVNSGASRLDNNLMIGKVPDGTTFTSAFIAATANATIYYNVDGASNADDDPPDFDAATGIFGSTWTTSQPAADTVVWVGFSVPMLASNFFPEEGIPTRAIGNISVVVDRPPDACPEATVVARGSYYLYDVVPVGGGEPPAFDGGLVYSDTEPVEVIPLVPNVSEVTVSDAPNTLLGPGPLTYTVNIPNRHPNEAGGVEAETDTARDVVVRLTMPNTSVNGVNMFLPFASVDAGGGSADLSELPNAITVTYPTIGPRVSRVIRVNVTAPQGMVDGSTVGLTAQVTAQDDICGTFTGSDSESTAIRVEPALSAAKSVNLSVANLGDPVEFTIDYDNTGDGVATAAWIIDRVTDGFVFESAEAPAVGGAVWFSNAQPPQLPTSLRDDFTFDESVVVTSGLFVPGTLGGDGRYTSPFGPSTTYVAFQIDDPSLAPPQVPTGRTGSLRFIVTVDDADTGDTLGNEALVFSEELLGAISNQVQVTVSANPSIRVSRSCTDVATASETITYVLDYFNDASNLDESVVLEELLPDEVTFVDAVHTWNAATEGAYDAIDVPAEQDGSTVRFQVTDALAGPLRSLEGGQIVIRVRVNDDVASGTITALSGLAFASNGAINTPVTAFSTCELLVSNADITVTKRVDRADPVAGDTLNYTLTISNPGAHFAENVSIRDVLPSGLTYVAGSTRITTPGWQLTANTEPTVVAGSLNWGVGTSNALTGPGAAGFLPGSQGAISLIYQATVNGGVAPDTRLENCATVATTTVEDALAPNEACAEVRTPLPDPYVNKRAPELARPGDRVGYRLLYGNNSRQTSDPVVVIDSLYDGPTADGTVDVTYLTHTATNGESVWFASSAPTGPLPSFDPADPSASGWTQDAASLAAVTHIAFFAGPLASGAGPFSVYVDVELRNPIDGALPQPGATILNTASIQMVGPNPSEDDDDANNTSVVSTRTPAVDISISTVCDPNGGFPGTRPGEEVALTLELENTGTVPALGLAIVDMLPPELELTDTSAANVVVVDAQGAPSALVGLDGEQIDFTVPWTVENGTYTLGQRAAVDEPTYYRRVGLAPGDKVQLTISAQVSSAVPSETTLTNVGMAVTDYAIGFQPGDPEEEILTNNSDSCSVVVYRPDPLVVKTVVNADGSDGPVGVGERVTYTLNYDNIGGAVADRALLEDYLPTGTRYVVGSFAGLPDGSELKFDDGSGTFAYIPVGETGAVDDAVTAVRIDWGDTTLKAPSNATFEQLTAIQFEDGTFVGTKVIAERDGVGLGGGISENPAYFSPVFPADDEGVVLEWGRIVVSTFIPAESDGSVLVTVLDADNDVPVPGFIGITPDDTGVVDLGAIDPADYPRLQLRADFAGGGVECGGAATTGLTYLESATPYLEAGVVNFASGQGIAAGRLGNGKGERAAVWDPGAAEGEDFQQALDQLGPIVGRNGILFSADGTYVVTVEVGSAFSHESVIFTPDGAGVYQPTAFLPDDIDRPEHASVKIKDVNAGVAVGERRIREADIGRGDDGPPSAFIAVLGPDGVWTEAAITSEFNGNSEVSLRFVNDDRVIFGECENAREGLGSQLVACVFEPSGDGWIQVADTNSENAADWYVNVDLAAITGGGGVIMQARVGFQTVAVHLTQIDGTWVASALLAPSGDPFVLPRTWSILGSAHFFVTDKGAPYIVASTGVGDTLAIQPVVTGDANPADISIVKADASGTLFGEIAQRATVWRVGPTGYEATDLGEAFAFSEIVTTNTSGLARGWVGMPFEEGACTDDTRTTTFTVPDEQCGTPEGCPDLTVSCSHELPRCSCSRDSDCRSDRRSQVALCIAGTCVEKRGMAWVPDAAEETGFRRVTLENSTFTRNEDSYQPYGWTIEDTDYPGVVGEDGRIYGVRDRISMPHFCEEGWDEWTQPLPVYWEPGSVTGVAPMNTIATEEEHSAAVYAANASNILVGRSYDSTGTGRASIWTPNAGAVGGWSPALLPTLTFTEVQQSSAVAVLTATEEAPFYPWYSPDSLAQHVSDDGTVGGSTEYVLVTPNGDLARRRWYSFGTLWTPTADGYNMTLLPPGNGSNAYDHVLEVLANGLVFGVDGGDLEYSELNGEFRDHIYWAPREDGEYISLLANPVAPLQNYADRLQHNTNGLIYGTTKQDQGTNAFVMIPDASEAQAARVIFLPTDGVSTLVYDMNASDIVVGQVKTAAAALATAWVPSGVDTWTRVDLGPGIAEYIDDMGRIGGSTLEGAAVIWEPQGNDTWTAVTLPNPGGVGIKPRRDLFKAGFVLGDDGQTVWETVADTWQIIVLPAPAAAKGLVSVITAVEAPALGGHAYVGMSAEGEYGEGDLPSHRVYVWNPDGAGGYVAADVTPAGKQNAEIFDGFPYRQATNGLIAINTNDFDYQADVNDLLESDTRGHSERFALVADPAAANGWTPILLGIPVGKSGNELRPQPSAVGLWTLESHGRDTTPAVLGCETKPGAFLDAWRVIYRTDQSPSLSFQVEVADVCQTSIANTATISTTTPEITSANNSSTATFPVATTDLRVALGVDRGTAAFDDLLTYTLTVTNDGPSNADNVVASTTPAAGTNGIPRTFNVGALAAGAVETFVFTATVTEVDNGQSLVANADVSTSSIDCNAGNDASSATTITGNLPNVYVDVAGPPVVRVNEPFVYTITYGNNGNAPATDVVVTDLLPPGVTLVPADQDPVVAMLDTLDADGTGTATLTVVVTDCSLIGTTLTNSATITAAADTNGTDNTAQVVTAVAAPNATLDLAVVSDRSSAEVGDRVTFTVHFINTGSSDVTDAVIAVPLPTGTLIEDAITGGGTLVGTDLVWALPRIAAASSGAVAFQMEVAAGGPVTAMAAGMGVGVCPSASDAASVEVVAPGIHVVKSADTSATCGDTQIGWSILVTNTSDTDIAGVVVTDALPAGVTYVADSITGLGALDQGAPTLVWSVGTLAAGAGMTLSYLTSSPADAGRLLTNSANVEVGGTIVRTSAAAAIRVDCGARLVLDKVVALGCAQPGEAVDVVVSVTNSSQSAATNVVVTDSVPLALDVVGTDPDSTYSLATREIRLEVGDLAPGASATVTYQTTIATTPASGSLVLGQAAATLDGGNPVVSNGTASVILRCDDLNACTANLCDAGTGCVYAAVDDGTMCDDADACSQTDSCVSGTCVGAEPVTCTASDQCHVAGVCDSATGLCSSPNADDGLGCDDGNACTVSDACAEGTCVSDTPTDCDDGDTCTSDRCDTDTGCFTEDATDGLECDDSDLCSLTSACVAGTCLAVDAADCDDANLCTLDRCDPATGCFSQPVPNGFPCSDVNLCTTEDTCVDGQCMGVEQPCAEPDVCRFPGTCNTATGVCDYPVRPGDNPVPVSLTDLGTLGGDNSVAFAVNETAVVVGSAQTESGTRHAFRWIDGAMTDLTPMATDAVAIAVNDAGIAAGTMSTVDGATAAFVAQVDGLAAALWSLGSLATDAAQIVGPTA
ncbi:MAG: putative repeat protein (TIGR01451 family), partial [Myxococcota bacterium]